MENNDNIVVPKKERITSLDALRAFTLLGILIVHAKTGFGFPYDGVHSLLDLLAIKFDVLFLENKCNTIFAVLFGVSFYLILRNPKNTSAKFVWRCFLLALIGLFNQLVYTHDILMWYGLWGMILVFFRNLRPKYLIISCICLYVISTFLARIEFGDMLFGPGIGDRYGVDKSFYDVITYPNSTIDLLRNLLNHGILGSALVKFVLGYWIAKVGFIEHVKDRLKKRYLVMAWALFMVLFIVDYKLDSVWPDINFYLKRTIRLFSNYSASAAYASALLYAYYHSGLCNRILKKFEPYGKLGLTNYSMGGILGVIFINEFGLGLYKYGVTVIFIFFTMFFLLQAVFSYYWLRYFTYGPMEYVWRVATERKKIPFRRRYSE